MGADVARETLVMVLRAGDVQVTESFDQKGNLSARLAKGDTVETQFLPEVVPHRLVMRLLCKFDVNRDWAWHPDRIPADKRPAAPAAN